jgi:hypothetical protein
MKPLYQRIGEVAQILLVPMAAFQLGVYSQSFSGSAWAWIALVGYCVLLALLLLKLIYDQQTRN